MTLKDFHGGSIPSDLSLPSAPGVIRDQQMSWGNSLGRSDHRSRPSSAGSARNLDEKAPFLTHSSHIGRNFDEDERKPLDGVSGPRRTVGDESIHSQSSVVRELKVDNQAGARVGSRPYSVPIPQTSSSISSSYAGRVSELHNARLNSQTFISGHGYGSNYPNMGGNAGQAVAGSYPNAWGIRKETAGEKDPVSIAWSGPDAATKLAHASALEKVSSGRWSSKQHVNLLKGSEVFGHPETEGELGYNANSSYSKKIYNSADVAGDYESYDVSLMMHAERSLAVDDGIDGAGKDTPTNERAGSTIHMEPYMRNTSITVNGFQSPQSTGQSVGTDFQSTLSPESSERPKLKLLPRSKPLESLGPTVDNKQGYEQMSNHRHVEISYAVQEPKNCVQTGSAGSVVVDRAPVRPKLNLKPRTQPLEQIEGNSEVKRGTVFGGARPREVVLKERGIVDDASYYESQPALRFKEGVPKADTFMNVTTTRYPEKAESLPTDQNMAKYADRRDHQMDGGRGDSQRKNWQTDIRRNNRDMEKRNQQQKQLQDRPPSPETWRKPVEHARPASPDAPPPRFGKAASAVELAQAFSKSVSNPAVTDRLSGPRGIPSHSNQNQMPFSRLMGPTPRPQINGY